MKKVRPEFASVRFSHPGGKTSFPERASGPACAFIISRTRRWILLISSAPPRSRGGFFFGAAAAGREDCGRGRLWSWRIEMPMSFACSAKTCGNERMLRINVSCKATSFAQPLTLCGLELLGEARTLYRNQSSRRLVGGKPSSKLTGSERGKSHLYRSKIGGCVSPVQRVGAVVPHDAVLLSAPSRLPVVVPLRDDLSVRGGCALPTGSPLFKAAHGYASLRRSVSYYPAYIIHFIR